MTSWIVFITIKIRSILILSDLSLLSFHNQNSWSVTEICNFSILFRNRVAAGWGLEESSHSPGRIVASSPGDVQLQECQEELP